MKTCEWCKAEFEPSNDEQAYCKPTHATKANAKRRKERLALEMAGRCPTPYKRSWSSVEQAAAFHLPSTQYLYNCSCGAIHAATHREHRTLKATA